MSWVNKAPCGGEEPRHTRWKSEETLLVYLPSSEKQNAKSKKGKGGRSGVPPRQRGDAPPGGGAVGALLWERNGALVWEGGAVPLVL